MFTDYSLRREEKLTAKFSKNGVWWFFIIDQYDKKTRSLRFRQAIYAFLQFHLPVR